MGPLFSLYYTLMIGDSIALLMKTIEVTNDLFLGCNSNILVNSNLIVLLLFLRQGIFCVRQAGLNSISSCLYSWIMESLMGPTISYMFSDFFEKEILFIFYFINWYLPPKILS